MAKMESALQNSGFEVINLAYASRSGSIKNLSEGLVKRLHNDERCAEASQLHFVTHSLGGILVRSMLATRPFPNLGRVVMLGPPNQGSEVVDRLGPWRLFQWVNGPAGRELSTRTNSTPNQLGPVNFELGVIAGDRSINWINSLWIAGPDDGKVSVERTAVGGMRDHVVIHTTHPLMMKNRHVIAETIRFLQIGQFSASGERLPGELPPSSVARNQQLR
jgi:hypothetical protein